MAGKRIETKQFYAEDVHGNFCGLYEEGDAIKVVVFGGKTVEGIIDEIWEHHLVVSDYEEESITEIQYADIVDVEEG